MSDSYVHGLKEIIETRGAFGYKTTPTFSLSNGIILKFRPLRQADFSFIMSSWLKSFHKAPANVRIRNDEYFVFQGKIINALLERSKVTIVTTLEDEEQIVGYVVVENKDTIHYIYVKYPFRKLGVADALFNAAIDFSQPHIVLTHMTRNSWIDKWFDVLGPERLKYIPYYQHFRREE